MDQNKDLEFLESIEQEIERGDFDVENVLPVSNTPKISKLTKLKESSFVKKASKQTWTMLLPFFVVMGFLVILPLLSIVVYSIIQPTNDSLVFQISFENFLSIFKNGNIWTAMGLSILYAFIAALVAVVMAYPIAAIMAKMKNKFAVKNVWVLVTMPIWISMMLKTLGLQSLFYILAPSVLGTSFAIMIGMVYAFLPFAISPIYNALENQDRTLAEASLDLGASKSKAFWHNTFRQSLPGVFTAFSLVLVQSATSLVIVKYMGDGKINLITSIIESYFFKGSDFGMGSTIAVILAIMVFALILILKAFSNKFETRRSKKWKISSNQAI